MQQAVRTNEVIVHDAAVLKKGHDRARGQNRQYPDHLSEDGRGRREGVARI